MQAGSLAFVVVAASCSGTRSAHVDPAAIRWEPPIEIARGGGQKGAWHQNESDFDYVDDPSVAFDADGDACVVWVDQAVSDVFFRAYSPGGTPRFARAVNVSRSPGVFSWLPRIAVAGDDVYVLWQEVTFSGGTHGGDTFFARSRDRGATFELPINLSHSIQGDGKGRINKDVWDNGSQALAVASDRTLYAAWTDYDGALKLSRSRDGGATFSEPALVADEPNRPARGPALAVASDGTVYLAWTVGEDAAADLRLATMRPRENAFGPPAIITHTPVFTDAPQIGVDASGVVHVVYAESDGGPFGRFHVRYMRSRDGGRTFEAARELSGRGGAQSAAFPTLAVDDGAVFVVWELYATAGAPARGLAIRYSVDGGHAFAPPVTVEHSADPAGGWNGSQQGHLMRKLAVRHRSLALVNSALAPGHGSRVWLLRGTLEHDTDARTGSGRSPL